ncbi:hypothetical protein [Dryocola sp. BD613]|uniref:hypothetical protein n=1 Tax=Dryocola sp. BD613 TaxID=3133272 RepID=UPI003F504800
MNSEEFDDGVRTAPVQKHIAAFNPDAINRINIRNIEPFTGWHAEYQHFTDNLPVHLRERIMVCDHPADIDVFSDKVIQKAMMLRT